ncbi:MAG: hypothetical protein AAF039_14755 [Bacteroidota bacterium]
MTALALLFDTGCFVLIWLVQLIIYPGFQYYHPNHLKTWHSKYTKRVTLVVLPLMLGQLILGTVQVASFHLLDLLKFGLILTTWLVTFVIFIPLHNKIATIEETRQVTNALVKKNWLRTGLWSLIFILSVLKHFIL